MAARPIKVLNVAGDNPDLRVSWCGYAEKRCNEDGPNIKPHGQSLQGLKTKSCRNLRARGSGYFFAFNPKSTVGEKRASRTTGQPGPTGILWTLVRFFRLRPYKGACVTWNAQMTLAELVEKLPALEDQSPRVVKSPGLWDGLNEASQIYDGYLDKDLQCPVQANEPDAIHVVFL